MIIKKSTINKVMYWCLAAFFPIFLTIPYLSLLLSSNLSLLRAAEYYSINIPSVLGAISTYSFIADSKRRNFIYVFCVLLVILIQTIFILYEFGFIKSSNMNEILIFVFIMHVFSLYPIYLLIKWIILKLNYLSSSFVNRINVYIVDDARVIENKALKDIAGVEFKEGCKRIKSARMLIDTTNKTIVDGVEDIIAATKDILCVIDDAQQQNYILSSKIEDLEIENKTIRQVLGKTETERDMLRRILVGSKDKVVSFMAAFFLGVITSLTSSFLFEVMKNMIMAG